MNKTFFAVALVVAVGLSSTTGAAYALSETERYNSGYSHDYMDVKNGAASYCSTSDHTYTYCQGYNAGYQAGQVQTQQIPSAMQLYDEIYNIPIRNDHQFPNATGWNCFTSL